MKADICRQGSVEMDVQTLTGCLTDLLASCVPSSESKAPGQLAVLKIAWKVMHCNDIRS